jgi:hypothetical protein
VQRSPIVEEIPSTSRSVLLVSPTQIPPSDPTLDTISEEMEYSVDPTKGN